MPVIVGPAEPDDRDRPYDFSRVGGFRVDKLTDLEKAQLLHRISDWAKEVLLKDAYDNRNNAKWREVFLPLLESLLKSSRQVALYIDNDQLRWDKPD